MIGCDFMRYLNRESTLYCRPKFVKLPMKVVSHYEPFFRVVTIIHVLIDDIFGLVKGLREMVY